MSGTYSRTYRGVPRIFHWGKGQDLGGVLAEGQQPPPHQLWVWGSAVTSAPQRGSGHSPDRQKVPTIFGTQDGLS